MKKAPIFPYLRRFGNCWREKNRCKRAEIAQLVRINSKICQSSTHAGPIEQLFLFGLGPRAKDGIINIVNRDLISTRISLLYDSISIYFDIDVSCC